MYLSVLHPHTPGLRHHLRKAYAEAAVRASPLNWTVLQPSMFAQIVLSTWGRAPAGPVEVPFGVDNEFSFIDLRGFGEAGMRVLSEQGHGSAAYELA
ncbi:SDR family oxidoreductase [Streptomyces sp. NPDC020597]|uniref:SDR family oxidoreductase n=1 Tax=unclassified Streptomyces TaxID=2593676 RepID=UPI00379BBCC8